MTNAEFIAAVRAALAKAQPVVSVSMPPAPDMDKVVLRYEGDSTRAEVQVAYSAPTWLADLCERLEAAEASREAYRAGQFRVADIARREAEVSCDWQARAEAAEREVERLREKLRDAHRAAKLTASFSTNIDWHNGVTAVVEILNAALAPADGGGR